MAVSDWLDANFSEVDPVGFYRDLFPLGELDERAAMTKGKYCGIAVQVLGARKAKRFTITDDLKAIVDLIQEDEFTVISPISYAGKKQSREMARNLYALTFDVDDLCVRSNGRDIGIETLFRQIENNLLPRPTYVVATGDRNIHLYYMLERAVPLFDNVIEQLINYRHELTETLWNAYVTDASEAVQQEAVTQAYRAVGSIRKDHKGRVRAWLTGDKVTIEYMNRFVRDENRVTRFAYKKDVIAATGSIKQEKRHGYHYTVNSGFYRWMLGRIESEAKIGKRYFCICALVIAGIKTDTPLKQIKKDAYDLIPLLDQQSPPDNRFTKSDVDKALSFYKPSYRYVRKKTIERMTGIKMPEHKKNGRTKEQHIKLLNLTNAARRMIGEEFATGRPTKRDLIADYVKEHPRATQRQIAAALGVSPSTVNKWLKILRSEQGE